MATDTDILTKAFLGLCEEIRGLRDDLYNHAVLTKPQAFQTTHQLSGNINIPLASMPPATGAAAQALRENTDTVPWAFLVHADPVTSVVPPVGLVLSQVLIALSVAGGNGAVSSALTVHVSYGEACVAVVKPGETLYASVQAEAAVNLKWHVVPLRGRKVLFPMES